jgi:hypothetical protein
VACVIDLWNQHQEMTLYVIKQSRVNADDHDHDNDSDSDSDSESGTEGFDSDDNDNDNRDNDRCAYAISIIQDYFSRVLSVLSNQKRGLVVLF